MTKRTCVVEGCDRDMDSRQMCAKHHRYWLDHTPKDQRPPLPKPDFWSFVNKVGPVPESNPSLGPCWVWTGRLSRGYGAYLNQGLAHRISWSDANGEIPNGLMILHHCDNPPCVNPGHLYAGTAADNVRDMYARGRNHVQPVRTHCRYGHALSGSNLCEGRSSTGDLYRRCRTCENEKRRINAQRKRARQSAQRPPAPAGRISSRMASDTYGIPKATILDWGERGLVSSAVKYGKEYWWDTEEIRHQVSLYKPKGSGPVIVEADTSPVDFYVLFGRGLAAHRKRLGLSQAQASAILSAHGLTAYGRSTVGHLETGRRFPVLAEINQVAVALGVAISDLLPRTDRRVELSARLLGSWQRRYGNSLFVSREEALRMIEMELTS